MENEPLSPTVRRAHEEEIAQTMIEGANARLRNHMLDNLYQGKWRAPGISVCCRGWMMHAEHDKDCIEAAPKNRDEREHGLAPRRAAAARRVGEALQDVGRQV